MDPWSCGFIEFTGLSSEYDEEDPVLRLDWQNPDGVLLDLREYLEAVCGEEFPASPVDPDGAVLLAAALNYAAKFTFDYQAKVVAFAAAAMQPGVVSGWNGDVFYLEGPMGIQVSAHDPFNQLYYLLETVAPDKNRGIYEKGWDKRPKQHLALLIASKLGAIRKRYNRECCT